MYKVSVKTIHTESTAAMPHIYFLDTNTFGASVAESLLEALLETEQVLKIIKSYILLVDRQKDIVIF